MLFLIAVFVVVILLVVREYLQSLRAEKQGKFNSRELSDRIAARAPEDVVDAQVARPITGEEPVGDAMIAPKSLALDAGAFAPLSDEQVKQRAAEQQFSGFFEFGRRDRIPSAADPRTKLIDQAMVGHGIATPEELVQIHEIGAKMDELRPQLAGAHVIAEQAVEADREARKRIREEKKAAAEQRKREHAERVAHRKATDIVHLGRGVSAGLADRRSNVEKLNAAGLPMLATPADLAGALGITIPELRFLAYHAEASMVTHYVQFLVPKKSGGERTLSAPHRKLAAAQRRIFSNVLEKLPTHDAAHGFVKSRSILTNATPHLGKRVVVNCDLTDFFPSITVHRVIGFFKQIGYSPAVATILALLVTECPRRRVIYNGKTWHVATGPRGLPQGACTSPAISNRIAKRLDSRLAGIAAKLGWTYTRYADDLTFSSDAPDAKVGYLLARVRHIADDEGFAINEKKTRALKQAARQMVTGVVVNTAPAAPRKVRRQMRAMLHNAAKTGIDAQNRKRRPNFRGWLNGMIGYVAMLNPRHARPLREKLDSLRA